MAKENVISQASANLATVTYFPGGEYPTQSSLSITIFEYSLL